MAESDALNSKRPADTSFKQQRLKAWQPILTPYWVIGTFMVVGIAFVPLGVELKRASDSVVEYVKPYDGKGVQTACSNVEYTPQSKGMQTCNLTINVKQKMEPPVYVYYELDHFYQNHRQYVKSRSDTQLQGKTAADVTLDTCDPLNSVKGNNGETLTLVPCGLIANSLFNDTFTLDPQSGHTMKADDIAWKSDLNNKFSNTGQVRYNHNDAAVCKKDKWNGYSDCTCPGGRTKCNKYLNQSYPHVINDGKGVTNQHFIVWMRTAGLPRFRKLYGIIDTAIEANTILNFRVDASFPVNAFGGSKSLVVATTSWAGGKNAFLGIAYIVVGAICLVLGAAFFVKHRLHPRKMGDTSRLRWGQTGISAARPHEQ